MTRVGTGFDIHRLAPGRDLVLCGVRFDSPVGAVGHSDGDVPVHALIDALLGAAAMGDIGARFPDTDPEWEGADSLEMLRIVRDELAQAGWKTVNADITVIAERPKIRDAAREMRENVARALGCDASLVSVKGKTMEKIGAVGSGTAIAAQAAALIEKCN